MYLIWINIDSGIKKIDFKIVNKKNRDMWIDFFVPSLIIIHPHIMWPKNMKMQRTILSPSKYLGASCSNNANRVKSSTLVCWLIDSSQTDAARARVCFTAAHPQGRGSERLQQFHSKHTEPLSSESDDETAHETWHRLFISDQEP